MSDIAKCLNKECDKKDECYRFTVKPNEFWQAYGGFECKNYNYFIDNKNR